MHTSARKRGCLQVASGRADVLVPRNAIPGLTRVVMKDRLHACGGA